MTKTSKPADDPEDAAGGSGPEDASLERALEGLFRLGANRRFDARQAAAVGAVVTRAGYAVLRALADHGTVGVRQLAEVCAMDGGTASRQAMQLVDEGLVQRKVADADARAVELSLTPRGAEVYERIVAYRLRHLTEVVRAWSAEERAELARLVERLAADLAATPLPR